MLCCLGVWHGHVALEIPSRPHGCVRIHPYTDQFLLNPVRDSRANIVITPSRSSGMTLDRGQVLLRDHSPTDADHPFETPVKAAEYVLFQKNPQMTVTTCLRLPMRRKIVHHLGLHNPGWRRCFYLGQERSCYITQQILSRPVSVFLVGQDRPFARLSKKQTHLGEACTHAVRREHSAGCGRTLQFDCNNPRCRDGRGSGKCLRGDRTGSRKTLGWFVPKADGFWPLASGRWRSSTWTSSGHRPSLYW